MCVSVCGGLLLIHLEVTSCLGWSLVQCRVADSVSETTEPHE